MNKIFGYDWEDIQRAQQGGRLGKPAQLQDDIGKHRESDAKLLQEHGIDKLIQMGYAGVVDRLTRSGMV